MIVRQLKKVLSTYCTNLKEVADAHGQDRDYATMDNMLEKAGKCQELLVKLEGLEDKAVLNIVNCEATFTAPERAILIHALYADVAFRSKRISEDNAALMDAVTVSGFLGRIGNE